MPVRWGDVAVKDIRKGTQKVRKGLWGERIFWDSVTQDRLVQHVTATEAAVTLPGDYAWMQYMLIGQFGEDGKSGGGVVGTNGGSGGRGGKGAPGDTAAAKLALASGDEFKVRLDGSDAVLTRTSTATSTAYDSAVQAAAVSVSDDGIDFGDVSDLAVSRHAMPDGGYAYRLQTDYAAGVRIRWAGVWDTTADIQLRYGATKPAAVTDGTLLATATNTGSTFAGDQTLTQAQAATGHWFWFALADTTQTISLTNRRLRLDGTHSGTIELARVGQGPGGGGGGGGSAGYRTFDDSSGDGGRGGTGGTGGAGVGPGGDGTGGGVRSVEYQSYRRRVCEDYQDCETRYRTETRTRTVQYEVRVPYTVRTCKEYTATRKFKCTSGLLLITNRRCHGNSCADSLTISINCTIGEEVTGDYLNCRVTTETRYRTETRTRTETYTVQVPYRHCETKTKCKWVTETDYIRPAAPGGPGGGGGRRDGTTGPDIPNNAPEGYTWYSNGVNGGDGEVGSVSERIAGVVYDPAGIEYQGTTYKSTDEGLLIMEFTDT